MSNPVDRLQIFINSSTPLVIDSILSELKSTVPLSTTRAEEIEELRDWAQKRAVPASLPEAKLKSVGAGQDT